MNNVEILEVRKENALQAYKEADTGGKSLLVNLFGKRHFLTDIKDRITCFADACAEVGEDPEDEKFFMGEPDELAYRKLKVIVKAYNGNWVPDWNNSSQYKYSPWFYLNTPGFRLNDFGSYWSVTDAGTGSRLCFKSGELAEHAAKTFKKEYEAFMVIPKKTVKKAAKKK